LQLGEDISQQAATRNAVEYHGVVKSFGTNTVLRGINLKIPLGQRVALIGRSGSGKTTLLRLLMTLETPDDGDIQVEGESMEWFHRGNRTYWREDQALRRIRGKIGMVFQHFNLFPHMTVLENLIEAPIQVSKVPRDAAIARAERLLGMVGLSAKRDAWPRQLSGGQQQRVAIARALAMEPRILLFDEITSALDPETVGEVLKVVRQIAADTGTTMLLVTHEMSFARDFADRVIFMDRGTVAEDDSPEIIFDRPTNPETRTFLKSVLER
jgi:polar amino acid transport system ATP-binding protein